MGHRRRILRQKFRLFCGIPGHVWCHHYLFRSFEDWQEKSSRGNCNDDARLAPGLSPKNKALAATAWEIAWETEKYVKMTVF